MQQPWAVAKTDGHELHWKTPNMLQWHAASATNSFPSMLAGSGPARQAAEQDGDDSSGGNEDGAAAATGRSLPTTGRWVTERGHKVLPRMHVS